MYIYCFIYFQSCFSELYYSYYVENFPQRFFLPPHTRLVENLSSLTRAQRTVTLCNYTVRRTPSSTNPYRPCRLCRTTTTIRSSLDRRRPVVRTHHHRLSENGWW